jgi:hypothetical protein
MSTADDYARWIVNNQDKKGTPDFDVVAKAYQQAKAEETATPAPSNSVGRQAGLFGRSAVKAAMAIPAMGADAIGGVANFAQDKLLGEGRGVRFQQTLPMLENLMSGAGLPQPETPMERIVSMGGEMGLGAGGAATLARKGADVATGVTKDVLSRLGSQRTLQVAGGAAGGAAGQQSKESGDGWVGQLVSTVVGGMLGAGGVQALRSGANAAAGLLPSQANQNITVQIDRRITQALQAQGVDPATINPAMRRALQEQVKAALKLGDVDEAAVGRLADYTRLGAEPTRRRLTLDPFDVTQELNAEKAAAATGARSARLPAISQDNNRLLLEKLDGFSPLTDRLAVGQAATAPIVRTDAAMKAAESALYGRAREMAGGDIPLNRGPVLNAINERLEKSMKAPFLPPEIQSILNRFSTDPNVPFTVDGIDNLKTIIATAQRGAKDGNVKAALKAVRDALDDTALVPTKRDFGGSQLVTPGTAARMTEADSAAADLMAQLNQARQAAFQRRSWQESSPLIEKTIDEADPARFVDSIVSRATSAKDTAQAARVINKDPAARDAVRSGIAQYLKDAAIGKGNASETGNFSGRQMKAALDNIGDAKLKLFFDADEVETFKSMARVGTIETFQPRGSAVNNSNTAAGMAGLLQGLTKFIKPVANKLPLGQELLTNPMDSMSISLMQRRAMDTPRGLLTPRVGPDGSLLDPLMLPAATGMGLLSAP